MEKKDSEALRDLLCELMLVILPGDPASKPKRRAHLDAVLGDERMKQFRALLISGGAFVHRLSFERHQNEFKALQLAEKEALILAMAKRKVRPPRFRPDLFVKVMISLTLEAALKDSEAKKRAAFGYGAQP